VRDYVSDDEQSVPLREHFEARLHDMDIRQQQRFDAQTKAIDAAMTAQRTAIDAALTAADKATLKAEQAAKDKFESMNEFRGTLTDQNATFMTRAESLSMFERNAERIQEIMRRLDGFAARDAVLAEYDRITTQVQGLSDRVTRSEGKGSGLQAGWGYIVAGIGLIATIIAIYIAIRG
jgi:hypothetical protein